MEAMTDARRAIPALHRLLDRPAMRALATQHGSGLVAEQLRTLLEEARGGGGAGLDRVLAEIDTRLALRLDRALSPSLRPILNATGVVVHTNLGRALLPERAARRAAEAAISPTNLELDLPTGERGNRETHIEARLQGLLRTEGSVVVNNCAAA